MKQKTKQNKQLIRRFASISIFGLAALLVLGSTLTPQARADEFDDRIAALRNENAQKQGVLAQLKDVARSYQDAINVLQSQINELQAQIDANVAQQVALQTQIDANQKELERQRKLLGADLKAMYVDGDISTIEMLATSKNLSDFIDKEAYRNAVQAKLQATLQKISQIQQALAVQKQAVDDLLVSQRTQQSRLDESRATQAHLLSFNQKEQADYNQQIITNQAKIGDLRRQQAILNAKYNIGNMKGDPNNGGYPSVWANAPQDSMVDSWGMYNRECVSYTAYMAHQDYLAGKNDRDMPYWGGMGNANEWDDNARAMGIPVDSNPTPGSIAISNAGTWGHAMYVAAVGEINGQQAIYIQQYNASFSGQYSEGWRYTTGLVFIHF